MDSDMTISAYGILGIRHGSKTYETCGVVEIVYSYLYQVLKKMTLTKF